MTGIYFLVPTLFTVAISLLIVRAGAIALMMTGMSFDTAKFQALSAFSGTGFTTREAERVVNNPRRRKIVSMLMVLGNAGIVTVIVTATSSFARVQGLQIGLNLLVLFGGLALIILGARHAPIVRRWEIFAHERLSRLRIFREQAVVDEVLHITESYGVVRVRVAEDSRLAGKTISDINDQIEHAVILGFERGKEWVPTPGLHRTVEKDDYLVIYGELANIEASLT
jgi:Trk K+ transport system NAD-binding subunit